MPEGDAVNRIEEFKKEKDGLEIWPEIVRYSGEGPEAIHERDKALMKWYGVFFRKHTPGFFMMRIRITNGVATAAQVRTLAEITGQLGAGFADITTRQQVQLRSVRIQDVPAIFRRLRDVGLTSLQTGMDNVRNVIGCPVAGLTPRELLDASPVAREFTRLFVGKGAYTNLPRKFNVAITGCLENCVGAESQDIAMVPARKGERVGFNVHVGGKMGSGGYRRADALDVFVEPAMAAEVAAAIVRVYRDHGPREARNRSRFAFLIDDWGVARVRAAVEETFGAPLEPAGEDARGETRTDHIGIYRQKDGRSYVGLVVPAGRVTAVQLKEVARLAETYGNGEVCFTTEQNLIIPHVADPALRELTGEPLLKELPYDPPEILRGLVVCTGIDFCDLALIDTKARALPMTRSLAAKLADRKEPLRIYWSGCPAGCGNHQLADIGFEGTKVRLDGKVVEAVDVWVGGRSGPEARPGQRIMENVPIAELPTVLEYLARHFPKQRPARTKAA
ncbi:MAG: ferredoxin--nitrite reductase [Deltaproteobacteria bacterium]|nr:MAG: ferredoxin--nitrite reductase [Deltaproteobacteria bacterium]